MEQFLLREFWGNSVLAYMEVLVTVIATMFFKRYISKYFAGLFLSIFSSHARGFHKKSFLELIIKPLESFLLLFIIVIAFDKLSLPSFLQFYIFRDVDFKSVIESLVNGALIILFIRFCVRSITFAALVLSEKVNNNGSENTNQLVVFFKDFFRIILIITGGLLILHFSLHYQVSNLVTGLSLVGAALALATKESLENLIASFIIFFDKPFSTGDFVKVQGFSGTVEKIGLRSTRIRTDQTSFITVPNKQMVDTILDNITLRTQRRADVNLQVSLSANAGQLEAFIEAIKAVLQSDIIQQKIVYLSDTGKTAHVITIQYFTSVSQSLDEFYLFQQSINLQLITLMQQHNIDPAAASTDVVVIQKTQAAS
jgi:MscS family membrane protein